MASWAPPRRACSISRQMPARAGLACSPHRNSSSSRCLVMSEDIGINQLKRRDFLKAGLVFGAGAAGLAAGYAAVPDAFARAVYAAKREGMTNDNVLVMIQLAGGNDGLRTVVPLADPSLHDLRPKLSGPMVSQALPLNSQYGLNHNLSGIKGLWDK